MVARCKLRVAGGPRCIEGIPSPPHFRQALRRVVREDPVGRAIAMHGMECTDTGLHEIIVAARRLRAEGEAEQGGDSWSR